MTMMSASGAEPAPATSHGRITPEGVARLREQIGQERRLTQQFNRVATPDAIRHFAHGSGDTNPLWTDPGYAATTRWGGLIAPPCFLSSCGMPRSVGLPGVHALYTGSSWHFERPVRAGEEIVTSTMLAELTDKPGRFADTQLLEVDEAIYRTVDGTVLARLRSHCMRMERRRSGRGRSKYADVPVPRYTTDEIEAIADHVEAERPRGAAPLLWDDVTVGEALPARVKGPLTITDLVGWVSGWGGMFIRPHAIGHAWRRRHPAAYTLDARGVPDVPERAHWDAEFAQAAGLPAPYDYGPQRIAWLSQVVTDWMGDDGRLCDLHVEVRGINLVGDTTWCRGRVTETVLDGDEGVVRCELEAVNQRDEVTATGWAAVVLPRAATGPRGGEGAITDDA